MLDLKLIQSNPDFVKENLLKRNFDISVIDNVLSLNEKRKELIALVESKRSETKKLSKEVGMLKRDGKDASDLMSQVSEIKSNIEDSDKELSQVDIDLKYLVSSLPNIVDSSIPDGKSDEDNTELKKWGSPNKFSFEAREHVELGEGLGLLDFESGAKLTGSRFVVYKGLLARLERALINFFLDQHTDAGYEEIIPPFIVNEDSLFGTGQLPKFAEDMFKIDGTNWYLISTAEIPLTNLKRGELFTADQFPIKYCGYTPCFRSEAGSYGKDTKGLIRLHQFNKVEMVCIVHPDDSQKIHDEMIRRAELMLEALELPYKSVLLCGGDIGFSANKCIDLEVWLPGQGKYREISSISNCSDFQARRAQIRFRGSDGKPAFAHTLNGSGLAVGRTVVAIMENYQLEDGSIQVPKVLVPYMGGVEIIKKS